MINKFLLSVLTFILAVPLVSCGGSGTGSSGVPPTLNKGEPSKILLHTNPNVAQTGSSIKFEARVLDRNGIPVANEPVFFTNLSPIGTLTTNSAEISLSAAGSEDVAYTNSSGIATATAHSFEQGFITVEAKVGEGIGQETARRTVFFSSAGLFLLPFMFLDVDGDGDGIYNEPDDFIFLQSDTDNEVIIRARVFDQFGLPEAFSVVLFGADVPYRVGTVAVCSDFSSDCEVVFPDGVQKIADQNGEAFVRVRFEPNSLKSVQTLFNILALADNNAFNILTLFVEPIFIGSVSLSANPRVVQTDGNSNIVAAVINNFNLPAPDGTIVNFRTEPANAQNDPDPCGFVEPFGQVTGGVAEVQFAAPALEGTCTVTGSTAGVSGSVNVIVTSKLIVLPESQTINGSLGGTATFTITGGLPPYSITTSDPTLPPTPSTVTASGGTFSVVVPAGTPSKTITYNIIDTLRETTSASVVIETDPLEVLPASATVNGVTGGTATFEIRNGTPGYSIFTSNPSFPPVPDFVASSGGTFSVTILPGTPENEATYTIIDADSNTVAATLTIEGPSITLGLFPDDVTVGPSDGQGGGAVSFTINGGLPPFTVTADDVTNILIDGSTSPVNIGNSTSFTVTNLFLCAANLFEVHSITVQDGSFAQDTAFYRIDSGPPFCVDIDPELTNIPSGSTGAFTITGGTTPYTIVSSDGLNACNDGATGTPNGDCGDPDDSDTWNISNDPSVISVTIPPSCSDPTYTTQTDCESNGETWTDRTGNYTLTVTDDNGATTVATIVVSS
jgi:hypothetical protein